MTVRVVVAEATPFLRLAVRNALAADGIGVTVELGSVEGLYEEVVKHRPDVVLLGAELDPEMRTLPRILADVPGACVLILSADASADSLLRAVRAGAAGFLLKDMAPERLPAIVRGAVEGEAAIPRRLTRALLTELRQDSVVDEGRQLLTVREREVLELLARGADDSAVALQLGIVDVTVRRHAASATRKLGAADRAGALAMYQAAPSRRSGAHRSAA